MPTKLYKLTRPDRTTNGGMKWRKGATHKIEPCANPQLCSGDVLHAYRNPNLAYLINPIHGNFNNPRLYEVEGSVVAEDWGKVGCFELAVVKELKKPSWVDSKDKWKVRLGFSILCARAVLHHFENSFPEDKRARKAIEAAEEYLKNPSKSAAWSARSARSAARSAESAAELDFGLLADEAAREGTKQ